MPTGFIDWIRFGSHERQKSAIELNPRRIPTVAPVLFHPCPRGSRGLRPGGYIKAPVGALYTGEEPAGPAAGDTNHAQAVSRGTARAFAEAFTNVYSG